MRSWVEYRSEDFSRHDLPKVRILLRKSRQFLLNGTMALALIALTLPAITCGPAHAEDPGISSRRASERTDFTDAEIKDGFFKIAFNPELQLGAPAERVRKFDEPVRIFLESKGEPDRRPEIEAVVADIRARVNHLDVAVTNDREKANFI